MNARCRLRIALGKLRMGLVTAGLVVETSPLLAHTGLGRRWELDRRQRRTQVEASATGDDRDPAAPDHVVDGSVRQPLIFSNGYIVSERHDPDQPDWVLRRSGDDRDSGIDRRGIRRNNL